MIFLPTMFKAMPLDALLDANSFFCFYRNAGRRLNACVHARDLSRWQMHATHEGYTPLLEKQLKRLTLGSNSGDTAKEYILP